MAAQMSRIIQLLSLILLVVPVGAAVAGDNPSLLAYELKRLDVPEVEALDRFEGKPLLLVFFEPECSWCYRQVKAINALGARCDNGFQALAIGVNSNRAGLQKELRRLRPDFPAYQASAELLDALGGVPATPFTLLGDSNGTYLNWMRGYQDEASLERFLRDQGALNCPA